MVKVLIRILEKNQILVDENSLFSQQPRSLPMVFASLKNKYYFPPLIDTNSFVTVDYDALINTKID